MTLQYLLPRTGPSDGNAIFPRMKRQLNQLSLSSDHAEKLFRSAYRRLPSALLAQDGSLSGNSRGAFGCKSRYAFEY
jgi:hypothetical protein